MVHGASGLFPTATRALHPACFELERHCETFRGSEGGQAIGVSTDRGSGFAGKTAGGDMYAGRNGNVYKNTGPGWSQYGNGSWSSVNSPGQRTRGTGCKTPPRERSQSREWS